MTDRAAAPLAAPLRAAAPAVVPLEAALDEALYGGKAVQLGAALRAGLPVPAGVAVAWTAVAAPDQPLEAALGAALEALGDLVAVRSSAVGEDSATASFAGQHATVLGVRDRAGLRAAFEEVRASAHTEAAVAYRHKLGLEVEPRMGIVVQQLVRAEVAGVLFSRDPLSGEDVRVVEASWGLGEAVVQGLVTPDRFRWARGGRLLGIEPGEKDLMIRWADAGGTEEVPVPPAEVGALCLPPEALGLLEALTARCEAIFGGTQDLEFAFAGGQLFLLQRRAITRG